ncbi:hypothetical protein GCM10009797_32210 [Nocardioides hwasunensis]
MVSSPLTTYCPPTSRKVEAWNSSNVGTFSPAGAALAGAIDRASAPALKAAAMDRLIVVFNIASLLPVGFGWPLQPTCLDRGMEAERSVRNVHCKNLQKFVRLSNAFVDCTFLRCAC